MMINWASRVWLDIWVGCEDLTNMNWL